jgi:hypothetical protein
VSLRRLSRASSVALRIFLVRCQFSNRHALLGPAGVDPSHHLHDAMVWVLLARRCRFGGGGRAASSNRRAVVELSTACLATRQHRSNACKWKNQASVGLQPRSRYANCGPLRSDMYELYEATRVQSLVDPSYFVPQVDVRSSFVNFETSKQYRPTTKKVG